MRTMDSQHDTDVSSTRSVLRSIICVWSLSMPVLSVLEIALMKTSDGRASIPAFEFYLTCPYHVL